MRRAHFPMLTLVADSLGKPCKDCGCWVTLPWGECMCPDWRAKREAAFEADYEAKKASEK